jgi:23S rRNA (uracil1939-C5)-methyltransferase
MTDFELSIETMAADGSGVGYRKGKALHVPYTIPGERILVRHEHEQAARGLRLLDGSADRVVPRCPHFGQGRCGICRWQHIDSAVQPLLKQDMFADMLAQLGRLPDALIDQALRPLIAAPEAWGYNHYVNFQVADGALAYPDTDGGTFAPIEDCPTMHPDLLAFYDALDLDLTGLRRVRLGRGDDGALMLMLTALEDAAPEIELDLPASVNLILPDNEPMNLIGDSHLRHTLDGQTFRVTAGSFIRPNIGALPALIRAVMTLLDPQPSDHVLDLYAGVGLFSAFAAPRVRLVTLVESYPPAATDADANLAAFESVDVIEGGVDAVLPSIEERPTAAIVDPPGRFGGLTDDTVAALSALGVKRLIYVSEAPPTLARDCRKLGKAGWRLTAAQPLDLAPQTPALEVVARFERG